MCQFGVYKRKFPSLLLHITSAILSCDCVYQNEQYRKNTIMKI